MRWDRFFEDLEGQLDSEWEAERSALDTEAERLRLSRVTLRERLLTLADEVSTQREPVLELAGGTLTIGRIVAVGADWAAVSGERERITIVPFWSLRSIALEHVDVLRSARAPTGGRRSALNERMGFGFVLRDMARRRNPVAVQLDTGRELTGTIDRAGADHLDLALHEQGVPRRAGVVTGHRIVAFAGVVAVRSDAASEMFG